MIGLFHPHRRTAVIVTHLKEVRAAAARSRPDRLRRSGTPVRPVVVEPARPAHAALTWEKQ